MENQRITCPLDRNHRVFVQGLQKHLKKCINTRYMNGPTKCPFNRQHQVDASQILEHCDTCPNSKNILNQKTIDKRKKNSSNNDSSPIQSSTNHSKPTITVGEKLLELINQSECMADPFVICPFNNNHRMKLNRYWRHFQECKTKHLNATDSISPLKNQHINNHSQISHDNSFLSMDNALIQENIYKNKDDLSLDNASSMKSTACHSPATLEENSTTSKDNFEIVAESQLETEMFHPKPLRRPAIEKLRISKIETPMIMKVPCIQGMEIHKTDKNSSEVDGMTNSESHHTITSDTNSKDLSSHCSNQLKSLVKKDIEFAELHEKLKNLKAEEVAIAKEIRILRQKEKKIEEEKNELIEMFKNIVFPSTNDNNDDDNN